jgi:hypothetical protein
MLMLTNSTFGWCDLYVMSVLSTNLSPQLNTPELIQPDATLADRVQSMVADFSKSAMYLSPEADLSDLFPDKPQKKHLHIIIQAPPSGK